MTNTYVIYTDGGKTKGEYNDFITERDLREITSTVWCGRAMQFKTVKGKYEAFTSPALAGYLFAVFPAVSYPDVKALKHVKYIHQLTERDIEGQPPYKDPSGVQRPGKWGLKDFMRFIDDEWEEAQRVQLNRKAVSKFKRGQELRSKDKRFEYFKLVFKEMRQGPGDPYPRAVVETDGMGRTAEIIVDVTDVEAV
jgi:hypothetical protein